MKICPKCESENKDNAKWCKNCGKIFDVPIPNQEIAEPITETNQLPIEVKQTNLLSNRRAIVLFISSIFFFIVVVTILYTFWLKPVQVEGSIFIVTKGAQNVKLGAVDVIVFSEEKFKPYLDERSPNVAEQSRAIAARYAECKRYASSGYFETDEQTSVYKKECDNELKQNKDNIIRWFVDDSPGIVAKAMSDADGKFSVKLPMSGKYFLVAKSSRLILTNTEDYFWVVPFKTGTDQQPVMLNNSNLWEPLSPFRDGPVLEE